MSVHGTRFYVPYTSASGQAGGLATLDVSNPAQPRLLDNLDLGPGSGPHMTMLANHGKRIVVADYFLNEDDFGKVHLDGDHFVRVFRVAGHHLVPDPRVQVDMNTVIPGVRLRPHGIAVTGMTMGGHD